MAKYIDTIVEPNKPGQVVAYSIGEKFYHKKQLPDPIDCKVMGLIVRLTEINKI